MKFTNKIKEHLEKVGMKQSELAELVNVRRETIVCLENGKYNPSLKLVRVCQTKNSNLSRRYL